MTVTGLCSLCKGDTLQRYEEAPTHLTTPTALTDRWRLYSLCKGDTLQRYEEAPTHLTTPTTLTDRWRLYSLCEGDTLQRWRVEPFVMVAGGQRWVPPGMTAGEAPVATAAQRGGQVRGGGEKGTEWLSLQRRCRAARCGREGRGLSSPGRAILAATLQGRPVREGGAGVERMDVHCRGSGFCYAGIINLVVTVFHLSPHTCDRVWSASVR